MHFTDKKAARFCKQKQKQKQTQNEKKKKNENKNKKNENKTKQKQTNTTKTKQKTKNKQTKTWCHIPQRPIVLASAGHLGLSLTVRQMLSSMFQCPRAIRFRS